MPPADPNPKPTQTTPPVNPTKNPADLPPQIDAPEGTGKLKTMGAPVVPRDATIVPPPVVLHNPIELDPANPAGAPRQEVYHRSAERRKAIDELRELQLRDPAKLTEADHDRIHELHYLANGEQPPGA